MCENDVHCPGNRAKKKFFLNCNKNFQSKKKQQLSSSLTIFRVSLDIHNAHFFVRSNRKNRKCRTRLELEKENFWHHSNWNYEDEIAIETSLPYYNFDSSYFFLADAPVCTVDKTIIVGAFRSENLNVVCEVHADPPPRSFKWKFNSSGETFELSKERHYKNASRSILHYTPIMDQDYGTLTCIGQNEVGEQVVPCVFQVVLAGELIFLPMDSSPSS